MRPALIQGARGRAAPARDQPTEAGPKPASVAPTAHAAGLACDGQIWSSWPPPRSWLLRPDSRHQLPFGAGGTPWPLVMSGLIWEKKPGGRAAI